MASTSEAAAPARYDARTSRAIKLARMTRDAIGIAFGLVLLGSGIVYWITRSWNYAWIIGIILVVASFVAFALHSTPFDRKWTPSSRFLLSVFGLVIGAYFLASSISLVGAVGQRAVGTYTDCQATSESGPAGICYAEVHWPDGTSDHLVINAYHPNGTKAAFVKPPAALSLLVEPGSQWTWPDALAFFGISAALILQALYSLGVLLFNALRRR
ncbi:MAG TPA: hypothetical protein VHZ97_16835 [Pseudonocardiaceae bacterium]|nr:hypothetical protein [Pseudonocardiaceae bacterium]